MIEWVGAVTGVLALTWNIYRIRHEGAVVRLRVSRHPAIKGGEHASLTVVNRGQQPTTFTHLLMIRHKTIFHKVAGKRPESVQTINPKSNQSLPIILKPGDIWWGTVSEETIRDELVLKGATYIYAFHAFSRFPEIVRLR